MKKKVISYVVMVGLMFTVLEMFAFVPAWLIDRQNLFDHRQEVLARLNDEGLANFSASSADPILGWRSYGPLVRQEENCLGVPVDYRYDASGARLYGGFDPDSTKIIVAGDSYTQGDEVDGDDTYSARLSALLGSSVANHGVNGYGPTQSVLNLREKIPSYPQAEVVIVGIMYENLYRMVNSYRPVLYSNAADYMLKPYMADGEVAPHPGVHVLENAGTFRQAANKAFDSDFWAKPKAEFPFLASLVRGLGSNYFRYVGLRRQVRDLGLPEYSLIFEADVIRLNLVSLLNRYARHAEQLRVQPVVIFIPKDRNDTVSASKFIQQHRFQIHSRLLMGDVGEFAGMDWKRFNIQEEHRDRICHPSAQGHQSIADYIAGLLWANNVWPAP